MELWIGSNTGVLRAWSLKEAIPQQPLITEPSSVRISPEVFFFHFDELSLKSFNTKIVQKCCSEMECLKAIMCVMEQELQAPDQTEIYMDVSWASKMVLSQLMQSEGNESERLTCHQLVNLKQTEHVKDGMLENIQMLHQVLPYAFTTHNTYDTLNSGRYALSIRPTSCLYAFAIISSEMTII